MRVQAYVDRELSFLTTVAPHKHAGVAALVSKELVVLVEEQVAPTNCGAERMAAMLTSVVRSQCDLLG